MRISDWSSDVCSSDLVEGLQDVSISVDEINGKIVGILAQLDLSAIEAEAVGRSNVAVDEHRLADPACRIRQTRTGHRAGQILKCFRNSRKGGVHLRNARHLAKCRQDRKCDV